MYGPRASTWVLRPLKAIQQGRIRLIDHGQGIFLHTYIDNLIDALHVAMRTPSLEGETIDVTDGDNAITWGRYLDDLAAIAGRPPITKDLSRSTALFISKMLMLGYRLFRIPPLVTPQAVFSFTNTQSVSLEKAQRLLGYSPTVDYHEGMQRVHQWLEKEHYV